MGFFVALVTRSIGLSLEGGLGWVGGVPSRWSLDFVGLSLEGEEVSRVGLWRLSLKKL